MEHISYIDVCLLVLVVLLGAKSIYQGFVRSIGYKARTLIKTQIVSLSAFLFGGPKGIRTLDLSDANRTLSHA